MEFESVIGFIEHLQLVTTSKDYCSTYFRVHYSTHFSELAISSSVFWQRLPTADVPLLLGSRTMPVPQLQRLSTNYPQLNSTPS
jgi:hypothetical protein